MSIVLECLSTPSVDTFTPLSYLSDGDHSTYLSSVSSAATYAVGTYAFRLRLIETFSTVVDLTSIFLDFSVLFSQLDGIFGTAMTYPWDTSAEVTITVTDTTGAHITNVTGTYPDYSATIALVYSSVSQIVVDIVVGAVRNASTPPLQNETCRPTGTYVRLRGYTSTTESVPDPDPDPDPEPDPTPSVSCTWVNEPITDCLYANDAAPVCAWVDEGYTYVAPTTGDVVWDWSTTTGMDFSYTTGAVDFSSTALDT